MRTICIVISDDDYPVIWDIEDNFACFTSTRIAYHLAYDTMLEVTIKARQEDMPAIERKLAPYM